MPNNIVASFCDVAYVMDLTHSTLCLVSNVSYWPIYRLDMDAINDLVTEQTDVGPHHSKL